LLYAAPVGPELLLDADQDSRPSTAVERDGDFIVTWTEHGQNTTAIYARLFTADGAPRGEGFRVTDHAAPNEDLSAVAVDADGDFVVVWTAPSGSDDAGVFARRFDPNGVPLGDQFRVGEFHAPGSDASPDVAMSAGGAFVVVWRDLEAMGRLYDAEGTAVGTAFRLAATPFPPDSSDGRGEHNPTVAMEPDGDFVVAWQRDDGFDNRRILARRFDATGSGTSGNIEVDSPFRNDDASSAGPGPDIAVDDDGDFLVAWQSYTGSYGIYGRRFTNAGAAQGDAFLVGTVGENPAVAMDAAGHAMISWIDYGGVLAKQYGPAGNSVGATQYVNTSPIGYGHPAVAANAAGQFVVAWVGDFGQSPGIFGQRFAPVAQEGSIGSFVWQDTDADGVRDADESGVDGVIVKLYNAAGAHVATTKTVEGHYRFDHVRPGEAHTVEIVLPEGMLMTRANAGGDEHADSDFAPESRRATFTLAANQADLSLDAGLIPQAIISGVKFSDADGDGVRDLDEPRLSGWVIYIDANGNDEFDAGEQSVVTDSNGAYSLAALRPGSYAVREVPQALWNGVAPSAGEHSVTVVAGEQRTSVNFANRTTVPTLFSAPDGPSHLAETPAQLGNLQPAVAVADNGNYVVAWMVANTEIGGLDVLARLFHASGDPLTAPFMVHSAPAGNQTNPSVAMTPGGMFVIAWESQPVAGEPLRIEARAYGVAGQPIGDQLVVNPLTGRDHSDPEVAVNDVGDFVVAWDTDANAQQGGSVYARLYNIKGVPKTDAFVVDELSGYSIGDASAAMDDSGDWVVSWYDLEPGSLTGIHAQRYNLAGQAVGDRIEVHEPLAHGAAHDLAMDDEGNFIVFSEGTIHRYDAQGRRLSAPIKLENAYSGAVAMDDDGGFVLFTQGEFQDTIRVRRFNAAGVYTDTAQRHRLRPTGRFAVAMNGDGEVVTAWSSHDEQCCSSSVHVQRFHDVQPATVSGVVWEDLDGDGIREEGEPTIDNVPVALADSSGFALSTTRTRDGGRYHFYAVPGMPYTLWADPPQAMVYTAANQGGDDTRDSDVDPGTRHVPPFSLAPGGAAAHVDFGVMKGVSIGGLIFDDGDGDGVRDEGEAGLGGREVYLDANDNGARDAGEQFALSGENGYYVFFGELRPGTYHVRQGTLPGGWTQTSPPGGVHHVTIASGQSRGDLNFGNRGPAVVPPSVRFVPHRTASDDAVDFVEIIFEQPVTGFEVSDLKLSQFWPDSNLLGPGQTLTTSDNKTFVLENLAGVTFSASQYTLAIVGAIVDSNGQPVSPTASVTFVQPTTDIPGTGGDDTFYVMLNRARNEIQVFDHEPTEGSAPIYAVGAYGSSFSINGGAGNDRVIVDAANGLPYNAVTIAFDGGEGSDEVVLRGSANEDRFAADESRTSVGNFGVSYDGVESIGIDGRGGDDAFSIEDSLDAAVMFDAGLGEATLSYSGDAHGVDASKLVTDRLHLVATDQAHLTLPDMPHLRSLDLSRSAEVLFHGPAEQVVRVDGISITHDARLGIWDGTLIVTASPETREALLDYLSGLVRDGRITSEIAEQPNRSIVVTRNPGLTTYNGHAVGPDDILVKATWRGDANFDGRVNADDYFRIDQGFLAQPQDPAYGEGDFNGDGRVNADDYFLIDQSFLAQPDTSAADDGAPSAVVNADGDHATASKQRRKRIARTPFAVDRPVRRAR
jgi:hypothetical protein